MSRRPQTLSWGKISRWLARFFLVGVVVLAWMAARLVAGESQDYFFTTWRMDDGLPQNHATAILQTRDGYLWLGSYNGVARFDGVRFTVFDSIKTPGLNNSRVISLYEDTGGSLWLGHETGELTRYSNGRFEPVTLPAGWPREPIDGVGEDADGDLWLLCRQGQVLRLRDGRITPPQLKLASPPVPLLVRDVRRNLWRLHNGRVNVIGANNASTTNSAPAGNEFIACIGPAREGGLWLAGSERVRWWMPGRPEKIWGPVPWGKSSVTSLLEGPHGELWVGTLDQGLFILQPDGTHAQYNHTNGFPHAWVRCLFQDREGTFWAGTGGGGLCAVRERRVSMVKVPDDWQRRTLLSVSAAVDGSLWIGTEGGGIYQYRPRDGRVTQFGEGDGLANVFVWSVLEDSDGQVWAGTWGAGMFRRTAGRFAPAPAPLNEPSRVLAMHTARDGALWIGTQQGLVRVKDGRIERFAQDLDQPDVRCVAETADGTIWFGMAGGGLGRWREGRATQLRKADGLPVDFIWSLLAEKDGTLWIGTFGGGLCRWRDGKFSTIGEREGLPGNIVCHIADDGRGFLWMSSYAGIFRIAQSDLHRCADGQAASVPVLSYGKADGLASLECSGGLQPAGCRTDDGRLWFPTSRGLAVVSPANVRTNTLPPPVVIEELTVDGLPAAGFRLSGSSARSRSSTGPASTAVPPSAAYRIPPGRQRFEFHYTALSFVASERVRFKYRLDGLDDDWVDAGTARAANYSYLAPGEYTFRVIACNNDGVWNETGAAVSLTLLPQFWQTWWFSMAAGFGVLVGVGAVVRAVTRRRYRRKLERLERQRAVERERARIAKDIHDDLGASLTRITLLSQSARVTAGADPARVTTDLDQIYATARELTRAMDEIVWAVNPHHDTLDSLVTYLGRFAQEFAGAAGIRCRLDVPIQLPAWPLTAETRHNLFLAVKEAVHNALKHARATEINLSLRLTQEGFTLVVQDNGCGFDAGKFEPGVAGPVTGDPARIASGNGLSNMRRRLEEIGGRCAINSGPGRGTRVTFTVPFHPVS